MFSFNNYLQLSIYLLTRKIHEYHLLCDIYHLLVEDGVEHGAGGRGLVCGNHVTSSENLIEVEVQILLGESNNSAGTLGQDECVERIMMRKRRKSES